LIKKLAKVHDFGEIPFKIRALMIRYTPASQLTLEGFDHPFDEQLSPDNRWVTLAALMPWDELASVYTKNLKTNKGRLSVDIRLVIGALIVKHRLGLSDRDTVEEIQENIYIQYFCGFKSFQTEPPFDASLFVEIRKRMGAEQFEAFNEVIITRTETLRPKRKRILKHEDSSGNSARGGETSSANPQEKETKKELPSNKGKIKIDATVANQQILYPTDLGLINTSRQESERIIDILFEFKKDELSKKPRTYRRNARKQYLALAKKKKKSKRAIRKAISSQLRFLKRNLATIHRMLDLFPAGPFPLNKRDQKIFWVIQHIYDQQKYMYDHRVHSHPNRIVNIYQPYVRPIVRGKDKAPVEFGAKISIMECEGMSRVDHISWEAFNEALDLKMQVEKYLKTFGRYPELLLADGIYLNRENRHWLKEKGIRIVGKPLGRPRKEQLSAYQKRKQKKERNQRNLVEGKIGQGKNGYGLNKIRARRQDTSQSWISAIFFVMNLVNLMKVAKKKLKQTIFSPINQLTNIIKIFFLQQNLTLNQKKLLFLKF